MMFHREICARMKGDDLLYQLERFVDIKGCDEVMV